MKTQSSWNLVGTAVALSLIKVAVGIETYSPSNEVKQAHNIPRIDYTKGGISEYDSFNFTSTSEVTGSKGQNYLMGVVTLPIILIGLAVVSLFFFNFLICCRFCCKCLRCAPSEEDINEHPEKVVKARNRVIFFFFFFMFVCLFADHMIYYGNTQLDLGAYDLIDAADELNDVFYNLGDSLDWTSGNSTLVNNQLDNSDCLKDTTYVSGDLATAKTDLQSGLTTLTDAIGSLSDMIDPMPTQIDRLKDAIEQYMVVYKTYVLFCSYAAIVALMFLYTIGVVLQSECILVILILASEGIVLVMSILCGIMMIFITFTADICMDPTEKFANLAPGSLKDVVLYFGECSVANPYSSSISSASSAMNEMSTAISAIGPLCYDVYALSSNTVDYRDEIGDWYDAGNNTLAISDSIDKLNTDLDCPTLQSIYHLLINESLCTNLFGGFYKFWVSEYVVSGMLFFVMIMASVIYHYFGVAWKLKKTEAHTHGEDEDEDKPVMIYEGEDEDEDGEDTGSEDNGKGYKEEYTFVPAGVDGTTSKLAEHEVEMI